MTMVNLNKERPFNFVATGQRKGHHAWEIRPSEINNVECSNFVLLVSYVTLPKNYHYFYGRFHHSTNELKNVLIYRLIYSYILIPSNREEADGIIADFDLSFKV